MNTSTEDFHNRQVFDSRVAAKCGIASRDCPFVVIHPPTQRLALARVLPKVWPVLRDEDHNVQVAKSMCNEAFHPPNVAQ